MSLFIASDSDGIRDDQGRHWAVVREPGTDRAEDVLAGLEGVTRVVIRPMFADLEGPAWLPACRERWGTFASAVGAAARRDLRLLVRPDAGAIVSDIPGTLSFLRTMPAFGLVLDPEAMMVESMAKDRLDHLVRFIDAMVGHPSCEAVVVGRPAGADGEVWERTLLAAAEGADKLVIRRGTPGG